MGNHRSKAANIRGFYLAHNTLLGLNDLNRYYICRNTKHNCCRSSAGFLPVWQKPGRLISIFMCEAQKILK